jgi:hypothetical protein
LTCFSSNADKWNKSFKKEEQVLQENTLKGDGNTRPLYHLADGIREQLLVEILHFGDEADKTPKQIQNLGCVLQQTHRINTVACGLSLQATLVMRKLRRVAVCPILRKKLSSSTCWMDIYINSTSPLNFLQEFQICVYIKHFHFEIRSFSILLLINFIFLGARDQGTFRGALHRATNRPAKQTNDE